MDTSGTYPVLSEDDPLFEIAEYTQAMSDALTGTWTKLTLLNGWVDYTGGGSYRNGLWWRVIGETLQISGIIKSGAANTTICNIPAAGRPQFAILQHISTSGGSAEINLDPATGNLLYRAGGPSAPSYAMFNLWIPRV